jgi:hypothetical protein
MTDRPSIVHIGYPKAASTFLQDYVASHPQLLYRMVSMDPLHDETLKNMQLRKSEDRNQGGLVEFVTNEKFAESLLLTGNSRIWHKYKFTPGAWDTVAPHVRVDAAECARRIKSGFGVNKALIIIRDQVDWLLSAYKYFLPRLPAGQKSFAEFCATPRGRIYLDAGHFDRTIDAYLDAFGEKNVKVLRTNLLRDEPEKFAKEFCQFLGVNSRPMPEARANVGSSNLNTLVRARFPGVDRLPAPLRKLGGEILSGFFSKEPSLFSQKEIDTIRARYAESNRRVETLLQEMEKVGVT